MNEQTNLINNQTKKLKKMNTIQIQHPKQNQKQKMNKKIKK